MAHSGITLVCHILYPEALFHPGEILDCPVTMSLIVAMMG